MIETLRAAWVIGRRDFTAIIFSKAFFFFLLGPLFPVIVAIAAGTVSSQTQKDIDRPLVGVALSPQESAALVRARVVLADKMGERRFPELTRVSAADAADPAKLLKDEKRGLTAILTGTLAEPKLTGTRGGADAWSGAVSLMAGYARAGDAAQLLPTVATAEVATSAGNVREAQLLTAQAAQGLLFLLTMLLAGMVLSNLVEEKANKIIEILAAAIPIDAVFLGKLFAMLAMAFVGIVVWGAAGYAGTVAFGGDLPNLPAPAVGWPLFILLGVVYFAMGYLMLGALFLGIGAMAQTVREVQTLSMPVTMMQLRVFFFAMSTVTKLGQPMEQAAAIFPFSSPFAMIARAAQSPDLAPHVVAIVGQIFFALLVIRIGVLLFRRNVMKSGSAGRKRWWRRTAKA